MEFGFLLYFLVVFGCGGLLLLGLTVYFVRELLVDADRPTWSARARRSKMVFFFALFLMGFLLFIPLRMMWATRIAAVTGIYKADGVWGNATLEMRKDGTFIETYHFKNEYTGKAEGDGSTQGRWRDQGRDWLTRDIFLEHFAPLAEYDKGHVGSRIVILMGYGGSTSMDVDSGANIVFLK